MNQELKNLMEKIEAESEITMETREVAFLEHLSKTGEFNHDIHDDALVGLAYDAALALGHTEAEAAALCGDSALEVEAQNNKLNIKNLLMTDGYVGSFGETWETPTPEMLERAIVGAMAKNEMTREQVVETLADGKALKWGQSPNYYYDHSDALIGTRRQPQEPEMILCDCGHSVPRGQVMSASLGSSCEECYDRMSN